MAARSVTIKVDNKFDVALVFDHDSIQHGIWGSNPPPRIEAGATAQWVAESNGVATGTEGTVWYRLDIQNSTGLVRLHWDNPFIGDNNFDQSGPDVVTVSRVGDGSGNDATAQWVVADASTTGDGIPDLWKTNGATIDPGDGVGPQFVDLPRMGATVGMPDIFVHLDWMEDASHSHRPSDAAIRLVVDAFKNAPYVARNGAVGINLHVDAGPSSVMNFTTGETWGAFSRAGALGEVTQLGTSSIDASGNINYDWTDFDKLKNRAGGLIKSGRASIFRYAVAAHQIGSLGNSGVARTSPGSDFIVSLGTFTAVTDMQTAGTFMHELGHVLGLDHGGSDGVNNKPNYPSIMNYLWQFSGISRGGAFVLDYSRVALAVLKEAGLNETVGLGPGSAGYGTARWVPAVSGAGGAFVQVANANGPIDWNGDGTATNADVPFDCNGDGMQTDLQPCNDWQILKLRGGAVGSGGYSPPSISVISPELTPTEQALIKPPDNIPPITTASLWPTPNLAGWNRTEVVVALTAIDDISGVARTEYDLDGMGPITYSVPVTIPDEGIHRFGFRSIDQSQNLEDRHQMEVRIDLTAPEVVIYYDPFADDLIVEGRDSLSGVLTSPVSPKNRTDIEWTPFGSDIAELRTYEVRDRADNTTTLYIKIRCSPCTYEASVLAIVYEDARHHDRDAANEREEMALLAHGHQSKLRARVPRNTLIFERIVGRNTIAPLLGVKQVIAIGERDARRIVRARWDVLDDYTILSREAGMRSCIPCCQSQANDRGKDRDEKRCDTQGGCDTSEHSATSRRERDCLVDNAKQEISAQQSSDLRSNCDEPSEISQADFRGMAMLHVVSENGRLYVLE